MIVKSRKKKIAKDIAKLPIYAKEEAFTIIEELEKANGLIDLPNINPMEGTDEPYYRLKFGDYRMIMYYEKEIETVKILSIYHRKDAYKKHNLPWRK